MTLLALVLACKPDDPVDTADTVDTDTTPTTPTTPTTTAILPATQVTDWCDAVLGGETRDVSGVVALSEAHAGLRLFTPDADWLAADEALALALLTEDADDAAAVWADALDDACFGIPATVALGAGSVQLVDGVAIVVPGTDDLSLPEGAVAVAVDLRDLPRGDATAEAIDRAVGLALAADLELGRIRVRTFEGFPMGWSESSIYSTDSDDTVVTIHGTGTADLPLAVLTSQRLSPEAATVAAGLRLAERAWVIGYDVHVAVAESYWTGTAEGGLVWRGRQLGDGVESLMDAWPDVVPADVSTSTPERALDGLVDLGAPAAVDATAERGTWSRWNRLDGDYVLADDLGTRRAALVVLHGTLRRFFPYFSVVGDVIDQSLLDAIDASDALTDGDRTGFVHVIGGFQHDIYDGHAFFGDAAAADASAELALQLEVIDGLPVVRSSAHDDVLAGDTIVSVDGVAIGDWLDDALSRHSAASDGYRFDLAMRELARVDTRTLGLRDPDGIERTEVVDGFPLEDGPLVPWGGTYRANGWLDDLGAPTVFYLNLNGEVTTADFQWRNCISEAASATAVVVDMRDYPAINHYGVAMALHDESFSSPYFGVPTWTGPEDFSWTPDRYALDPTTGAWGGPVVLIVGHKSVSAAENFSMMLHQDDDVVVVGQQSASTNGNITGVLLPGQYYAMFTGMEVLNPDGSVFHGVGIVPDVEVLPTAADYRDGVDPELEAAVDVALGL